MHGTMNIKKTYISLITKQEWGPRLKEADIIKSDLKEIGCENVVCSTGFEVKSIFRIL